MKRRHPDTVQCKLTQMLWCCSNEDIRDAILSLIHMFRDSTDKLERHEYRERVLGDHLKKALSSLDKRQRTLETNTEAMAATLGKLDERLTAIEAKLDHQVRARCCV